jgi:hypothetical protein
VINLVEVGPEHPCWKAVDDDDWNGATFTNWVLNAVVGQHVRLKPPPGLPKETVGKVWEAVASTASFVEVEGKTVHVLKHGQSHCKMQGTPGEWPDGHMWMSFESPDLRAAVTCEKCRQTEGFGPPYRSADA